MAVRDVYKRQGQVGLIDDIDMCILAGNVIDNAIEAAAKCSDPYVNVEITSRGGIFMDCLLYTSRCV